MKTALTVFPILFLDVSTPFMYTDSPYSLLFGLLGLMLIGVSNTLYWVIKTHTRPPSVKAQPNIILEQKDLLEEVDILLISKL